MQLRGSRSWRLTESVPELLHVALYVRDALHLPVPADLGPPRLTDPVPDRRTLLSGAERVEAGALWGGWWQALVDTEVRRHELSEEVELRAWASEHCVDLERAGAPPDFLGLADRPALRAGALALSSDAHTWVSETARAPDGHEPRFPWAMVKSVATAVASDRHVRLDDVRGSVLVLAVTGHWWREVQPGYVLCSTSAACDPAAARLVLRRAFDPRPGRQQRGRVDRRP